MLYRIVRPLATLCFLISYKKIYFSRSENVPKDKPVILAVNHPTMFLEPCMLACFLDQPLYFLARGDVFKNSFYILLLKSLHLLPIFRLKDGGYEKLKNNFSTFEYCFKALSEKKTILIMAEGSSIQEKRLRPLKKGPARLAFGTFEKYGDLDIHLVPVGVNFTYPDKFRSEVMFEFGSPIRISEYKSQFDEQPNEAIKNLTDHLEQALRKKIIIIEQQEDEHFTEYLFQMDRNNTDQPVFPVKSDSRDRFNREWQIANRVNNMEPSEKAVWKPRVDHYFSQLKEKGITDYALIRTSPPPQQLLYLIIGFIPFAVGYLGNYLPYFIGYLAGSRMRHIEDRLSIAVATSIGVFIIYYIAIVLLATYWQEPVFWGFIIILPFLGYFSLLYKSYFTQWKERNTLRKLKKSDSKKLKDERTMLQTLLK